MSHSSTYPFVCARRSHLRPHVLVACNEPGHGAEVVQITAKQTLQLGLLCGAVAGFTVEAVLFPLDTLKTRLQVGGHSFGAGGTSLLGNLYRGFSPAVLSSAPSTAVFFATYDYAKHELEARIDYKPFAHFCAAALGDVAASTVKLPFEVVKQQLQSGMHQGSLRLAVSSIFNAQGVSGFLSGYGSLLLRELPFDALQFPLYEFFKVKWSERKGSPLNTIEGATCGSLAGSIAGGLTAPIDTVKTRLMTQTASSNPYYHGVVDCFQKVCRDEGVLALFSGVVPRVVWLAAGGFVFFGAYEGTRRVVLPHLTARSSKTSTADTVVFVDLQQTDSSDL